MNISSDKLKEFTVLFEYFINSYPNTSKGIKHIKSYSQQRESGRRNYQAILEAKAAGEDITERVLLQLLPHKDTKKNWQQGAWIHTSYLSTCKLYSAKDNIRLVTVHNFIQIINTGIDNPDNRSKAYVMVNNIINNIVNSSEYEKNISDFISPILNALKPIDFLLISEKSISVINYFADKNYSYKLIDYPDINKVGWQLIEDLSSIMERFDLPALRQDDLFDMFCHWLVTEKKYNFKSDLIEGNLMNKSNPVELKPEKENIMPEAHPDSYFSEKNIFNS